MSEYTRYALYGRVSSMRQKEDETIEMQQDALRAYAKLHNLNVVGEYYDEAQSGTLPFVDRPEGRRLLEDAKAGAIDAVLFYRTDRLGRSAFEGLRICRQLNDLGVTLRSISETYDTATPIGKFIFTQMLSVAEMELSSIKQRMNDGKQRKISRGLASAKGRVAWGYIADEKTGKPVFDTRPYWGEKGRADVVRFVFQTLYDNPEMTHQKAAEHFKALGIPCAARHGWDYRYVRAMVTNTSYKGYRVYNEQSKIYKPVTVSFPPIVSAEMFDAVNAASIRRRVCVPHQAPRFKHKYLLNNGLVRCGQCGHTYSGFYATGSVGRYYGCNGKKGRKRINWMGNEPCTYARSVPASWLENIVWNECYKVLTDEDYVRKVLAEYYKPKEEKKSAVEKEELEKQLETATKERGNLIDLCLKNIITQDDLANRLPALDKRIAYLRKLLQGIKKEPAQNRPIEISNTLTNLRTLRLDLAKADDWDTKYKIIHALVHTVTVSTNKANNSIGVHIDLNLGANGLGKPCTAASLSSEIHSKRYSSVSTTTSFVVTLFSVPPILRVCRIYGEGHPRHNGCCQHSVMHFVFHNLTPFFDCVMIVT